MLLMHEVHRLVGTRWRDFEHAMRDDFRAILAKGDDARLLWFFHQAHGTGLSYVVVTITAVRGGASFGRHLEGLERGGLRGWSRALEGMRHGCPSKVLAPVEWSAFEEGSVDAVPTG